MRKSSASVHPARISLLGIKVDSLSLHELLKYIESAITRNDQVIISNVNLHAMNIAYSLRWFREFLNRSHVTFCDGVGVKLAARLTGQYLAYRFTPPDFVDSICAIAARLGWRLFFLGAMPGVAQQAADRLSEKFPHLLIGAHHGYFDKTTDSHENKMIISLINQFQPQILFLGFGMPMQEHWILENFHSLDVRIAIPVGALFDYLSGTLPRAPRWMTDNGFEWLGRLIIEPRRLWKRYIVGNPLFFWRLFIHHCLGVQLPY